ncbi:MAG: helix-turn-helix domain-containing protein [Bifidobacteriaceae bacterium]|nr:helix-turn-helix domain-containing protein [Bifidobacteriaceae bacterium]
MFDATAPAPRLSTGELEEKLGQAVRRARLAQRLAQTDLAELAAVSPSALAALENGRGSSTKTLVRVARALGRSDWLDGLAPAITISPLAIAASAGRNARPRRVSRSQRAPR